MWWWLKTIKLQFILSQLHNLNFADQPSLCGWRPGTVRGGAACVLWESRLFRRARHRLTLSPEEAGVGEACGPGGGRGGQAGAWRRRLCGRTLPGAHGVAGTAPHLLPCSRAVHTVEAEGLRPRHPPPSLPPCVRWCASVLVRRLAGRLRPFL